MTLDAYFLIFFIVFWKHDISYKNTVASNATTIALTVSFNPDYQIDFIMSCNYFKVISYTIKSFLNVVKMLTYLIYYVNTITN